MAGLFLWLGHVFAQDAPNVANFSPQSGNAQQAGKLSSVPVNIFTGVPIISVPIYSYGNANSGIGWNVSLSYFAGGAQMLEAPSTLGIGWSLNATSVISRTVKGMPDDISANGYLYSPVIPPDFRSNGDKYYYDTLDTQQDIFQFSIPGHSGTFYIGKDHQIVITPLSKLKITFPESQASIGMISAFKIVTEDGIIYDFKTVETTKISSLVNTQSGYANIFYNAAWYLTQITAPFSTDSILFNYFQSPAPNNGANYNYPQTAFIRNADGVVTSTYSPTGTVASSSTRINSIVFPDKKTLSFVYINAYPNSTADSPVAQINLSDTIFRYGYKLGYKSRDVLSISYPLGGGQPDTTWKNYRLLLTTVTPYTANGSKKGYTFSYQLPLLGSLSETSLATANQRDYWGFFNAAANVG